MSLNQFPRTLCSLSLLIGLALSSGLVRPVSAQIEPPPGSGTPTGTAGGGSRS